MTESRLHKSLLNARVNLIFYFITLFIAFFSRKIFLEKLGAEFIGLTTTISNLLQFLNLAELGISTAVGVVLYKPLFDKNQTVINEIISVFGHFYRRVGLIILICGIILSFFLPLMFSDTKFSLALILFIYYSFLASTLIGYFANYKQTLLGADQKNYVVTTYFHLSGLCKSIIQIVIAYQTSNYYYWVAIELTFGIIHSIILNHKIKKVYPWLSSNIKEGKKMSKKYPLIIKYTKQLFIHKIATLIQMQIHPILIYTFVSLKAVTYYGNYTLIIDKLSLLVKGILDGTSAGVGSLIAEGDKKKILSVFWELTSFRYFIAGFLIFSLFHLINPFISLWLDSSYILDKNILIIILCNTFIIQTRGTVDQFTYGYGLFNDIWAPITESALCLIIALIGGHFWGLPGVLMGNIASMIPIVVIWKPYFLFTKGFEEPIKNYWKEIAKHIILIVIAFCLTEVIIIHLLSANNINNYIEWILYAISICSIYAAILILEMLIFIKGFRKFSHRLYAILISKFKR